MLYLSQESHQELYRLCKHAVFQVCYVFYTNLAHLLNKQTGFYDKMCQ